MKRPIYNKTSTKENNLILVLQALIFTFNITKEFVLIEICCGPFVKTDFTGASFVTL